MFKKTTKINAIMVLVSATLFSQVVLAEENNNTNILIDTFIQCDSQFFQQLHKSQHDFKDIAPIISENNIAYFSVENMASEDGNTVYFKQPIQYKNLALTAYQNIFIQTSWLGKYYYWGFMINNNIDDVKESLKQIPWQQYSQSSFVADAQLYDIRKADAGWQNNPYTIDGVAPRAYTVEKSLYLEEQADGSTLLLCSIQGDLNNKLLSSIRPDVKIPEKPVLNTSIKQTEQSPESVSL